MTQGDDRISAFVGIGSFAERMLVHEHALVRIDADLPLDVACLVGCGVLTGVGAVLRTAARAAPGTPWPSSAAAASGCRSCRARRWPAPAGSSPSTGPRPKLDLARSLGATDTSTPPSADAVAAVRELTGGRGVDHAFEAVGVPALVRQAAESLAVRGTCTIVGVPPDGTVFEIPYAAIRPECTVQTCRMGSNRFRIDIPRYLDFYRKGRLRLDELVTRRARLDDVNDAFAALTAGEGARTVLLFDDVRTETSAFFRSGAVPGDAPAGPGPRSAAPQTQTATAAMARMAAPARRARRGRPDSHSRPTTAEAAARPTSDVEGRAIGAMNAQHETTQAPPSRTPTVSSDCTAAAPLNRRAPGRWQAAPRRPLDGRQLPAGGDGQAGGGQQLQGPGIGSVEQAAGVGHRLGDPVHRDPDGEVGAAGDGDGPAPSPPEYVAAHVDGQPGEDRPHHGHGHDEGVGDVAHGAGGRRVPAAEREGDDHQPGRRPEREGDDGLTGQPRSEGAPSTGDGNPRRLDGIGHGTLTTGRSRTLTVRELLRWRREQRTRPTRIVAVAGSR